MKFLPATCRDLVEKRRRQIPDTPCRPARISAVLRYDTGVSGAFPQAGNSLALSRQFYQLEPWRRPASLLTLVVNTLLRFLAPRDASRWEKLSMFMRVALVSTCVLWVSFAAAEELGPDQARAFIVDKLFEYSCFDGTTGRGRIFPDGSVVGTIQGREQSQARFADCPPGTIRVDGAAICAHLGGLPICFTVQKIDQRSFRGSVAGLGFAYCDFYQQNPRSVSNSPKPPTSTRLQKTLRPSLGD